MLLCLSCLIFSKLKWNWMVIEYFCGSWTHSVASELFVFVSWTSWWHKKSTTIFFRALCYVLVPVCASFSFASRLPTTSAGRNGLYNIPIPIVVCHTHWLSVVGSSLMIHYTQPSPLASSSLRSQNTNRQWRLTLSPVERSTDGNQLLIRNCLFAHCILMAREMTLNRLNSSLSDA